MNLPVSTRAGWLAMAITGLLMPQWGCGSSSSSAPAASTTVAPSITSFAPAASSVALGASTTLTAVFAGGTGVVTPGVGTVTSGVSVPVTPTETTTYTLTVTGTDGTPVTATTQVTVVALPAITSFTASPVSIAAGGSATLTPVFQNGTGTITPDIGTVTSGQAVTVSPSVSTTYTLTVEGEGGPTVTATAAVAVAPLITSFTVTPDTLAYGTDTLAATLAWNVSGATALSIDQGIGTVTGSSLAVNPVGVSVTYTLTATNDAGSTTATATVATTGFPSAASRTWTPASTTQVVLPRNRKGFAFGAPFTGTYVGVSGTESKSSSTSATSYQYVTIKLDTGVTRAWPVDSFSADDKAYVALQAAYKTPYPTDPNTYDVYPTNYELTDPVLTHETQHFCFWWGNDESKYLSAGALWKKAAFRQATFDYYEYIWNFLHYERGIHMPYQETTDVVKDGNGRTVTGRKKINVFITDTGLSSNPDGWANGGFDFQVAPGATLIGSTTVAHEMTHTIQYFSGGFQGWDSTANVGWIWESHAGLDSFAVQPIYPQVLEQWNNHMFWETNSDRMRYGSWLFMQDAYENCTPSTLPWDFWFQASRTSGGNATEDPTQAFIRVGSLEGIFPGDGDITQATQGFGDMMGHMAGRVATMDYIFQQTLYDFVGYPQVTPDTDYPRYTPAEAVPDRAGYWRPFYSAYPLQYGMNIIKLVPTGGTIDVTVEGLAESSPQQQDFRAILVVADADFHNARYSDMVHTGALSITPTSTETNAFLAVTAAPTAYQIDGYRQGFQRRRPYVYEFTVSGATPQAPLPLKSTDGVDGTAFSNGGGFVATAATVASTAYVGPDAVVLGGTVSGNARIEGHAMVLGGTVKDNAILSDYAVVDGGVVSGNARIRGAARVSTGTVTDNACLYDLVRLDGVTGTLGGSAVGKDSAWFAYGSYGANGSAIIARDAEFGPSKDVSLGRFYEFCADSSTLAASAQDGKYLYANWNFDQPQPDHVLMDAWVSNDGILRGATVPTFTTDGTRNVMVLNGTDQYALVGKDVSDTQSTTYDVMIKWAGGADDQRIFDFGTDAANSLYLTPSDSGNHVLSLVARHGGSTYGLHAASALETGVWHQVRVEISGTSGNAQARLYVDGVQKIMGSIGILPEDLRATSNFIGRSQAGTGFLNGSLDHFRIFRTVYDGNTFDTATATLPSAEWTYTAPVPPTN